MKEFSALGNLKLIFGIPCIKVLFLDVAGMTNAHGLLTLRAIIPAEVTQEDALRGDWRKEKTEWCGSVRRMAARCSAAWQSL